MKSWVMAHFHNLDKYFNHSSAEPDVEALAYNSIVTGSLTQEETKVDNDSGSGFGDDSGDGDDSGVSVDRDSEVEEAGPGNGNSEWR
jgi:hypothetical protein